VTGRNEQCPCGSGKKFKHCCIRAATEEVNRPMPRRRTIPPEVLADLERRRNEDERRREQYGATRPVVTTEFGEHRIVAVGDTVFWGKSWKTFTDFLLYYIKSVLGVDWGNAELAKPLQERHTILQWYNALCELQRREKENSKPDDEGRYSSEPDGPSRAYLLLAYDLYVVRNHATLQASLVKRLQHPEQFQGARYELFVAATMIRAGCELAFEDETDPSAKHTEFLATHKESGEVVAVEAKSRHRPGVLGRGGAAQGVTGFKAGIGNLLRNALKKRPQHPYLIFIDANMPPEIASPLSIVDWPREVRDTVQSVDSGVTDAGIVVGSGFNMLVVTNTPDHYGDPGGAAPGYIFFRLIAANPVHPVRDGRVFDAVERALQQAINIPQEFPDT
jgi:hypothetical protein